MFVRGYIDVISTCQVNSWQPLVVSKIEFRQASSHTLIAIPQDFIPDEQEFVKHLRSSFLSLSARVLFRELIAVGFYLDKAERDTGEIVLVGRFDIRLTDNRTIIGLARHSGPPQDLFLVRDEIIESELASSDPVRTFQLLSEPVLLNALENFIRALLYPDNALPYLYKSIEVIQKRLGSRLKFSLIGLSKKYVDYVMGRANDEQADQRHAPADAQNTHSINKAEMHECLLRTREVITKYVASL